MKNQKCQTYTDSAGFTLLEMLVIVVIIGVLGSIAAPGWLSYLNRQRVHSVRDELRAVLQEAQTNAQQKSTTYSVVLGSTVNGPTASISTAGSVGPAVILGSNTKNVQLSTFINSTASTEALEFDYRGGVSEDLIPFVIKIKANNNNNSQKCLIVNNLLGGIVNAEETTCDNPDLGI